MSTSIAYTCARRNASTFARSKSQPLWGTAARPASADEQTRQYPPAKDYPVVDSEDPLQVAKAEALHPSRASASLEPLNYSASGAVEGEAGVQACGNLARLTDTEQRVYQSVLRLGPATASAATTAGAAPRGMRRMHRNRRRTQRDRDGHLRFVVRHHHGPTGPRA